MTRLTEHKKKEMSQQTTSLLVLFIIIAIVMFTFGFKLMLQGTEFIHNVFSSSKDASDEEDSGDFIGTLNVEELPAATNSARLLVSGTTTNFPVVEFYINSEKVESIDVDSSNEFSEEIGDLDKGDNEIYVKAVAKKFKKTRTSSTFTVLYKDTKPKLEITEPGDNSKVSKQEVKVSGSTDKGNTVTVNNLPVVVDVNGNFSTIYRSKDGENKLSIKATDLAQNTEEKIITVNYQKDD